MEKRQPGGQAEWADSQKEKKVSRKEERDSRKNLIAQRRKGKGEEGLGDKKKD